MPTLFTIDTEHLTLSWSQRRVKPVPVEPAEAERPFGLRVEPVQRGAMPAVHLEAGAVARLFEETDYTVFVQSKTDQPVHVRHRDPVLVQGLQRAGGGHIIHGTVNFGAQVGQSRFVVAVGSVPQFAFEVEVFPSKLDYRRDYAALREEVHEIAAGLVLDYLRATHAPGWEAPPGPPATVAWMLLLRHLCGDLEQALTYAARQPQWETRRVVETRRAERIRRPDPTLRRAVQQGQGHGARQRVHPGLLIRERLPGMTGHYSLDTPAHRWLAARLALIQTRLADLHAEESRRRSSARRRRVRDEIEAMQRRIARLTRLPIIEEAVGEPPQEPPWRLLTASGYREAYRACVRLQQGLHLERGPHRLPLKELHLLYEYWCFLTLARLVADAAGHHAPLRALIAVARRGLQVRLRKGHAQTLSFSLAVGRWIELTYNPRFGGPSYLVPQQPDMLLTLRRADGVLARYVLDAKYRLDASPSYRRRYGVPGPPTEALNTLHRYRDAIQDGSGGRAVAQAVALFPYREEAPGLFAQSRHRRMLDEIGIGAIPLLPGHTLHLAAWLEETMG